MPEEQIQVPQTSKSVVFSPSTSFSDDVEKSIAVDRVEQYNLDKQRIAQEVAELSIYKPADSPLQRLKNVFTQK